MENQTTENVEFVASEATAPTVEPKKTRFASAVAFVQRTPKWAMITVPVLAIALLAYNGGYLQKAGSKASEVIAAMTPSLGTPVSAEDKLTVARSAFAAGDIKGSIDGYRAFIAANPTDISARGELGNVLYTVGAINEASQAFFETANLAIEQNQIEVAEALLPAVSEGNPMLANELNDKLFDHQVRTNLSQRAQPVQQQQQPQQQG
jgi:hypothetical protein